MCIEEARKSTDRYDFVTNHTEAYTAARDNGWTEEIYLLLGLRSRFDMSWRRPGTRKEIWCDADKYHKLWIESGMCGMDRMKTLTGFNLGKLLKKFKSGWVPTEDADWIDWASKIKLEQWNIQLKVQLYPALSRRHPLNDASSLLSSHVVWQFYKHLVRDEPQ